MKKVHFSFLIQIFYNIHVALKRCVKNKRTNTGFFEGSFPDCRGFILLLRLLARVLRSRIQGAVLTVSFIIGTLTTNGTPGLLAEGSVPGTCNKIGIMQNEGPSQKCRKYTVKGQMVSLFTQAAGGAEVACEFKFSPSQMKREESGDGAQG